MPAEPIAIVGRSCVLPGALSPGELWRNLAAGVSSIGSPPEGRWGLPHGLVLHGAETAADRAWSDAGGYVDLDAFASVFDPTGFAIPAEEIRELDPLFQWVLHGARESLRPVGHEGRSPRAGLVLGNLSFPTEFMTRYAECVWLDQQGPGLAGGRAREQAGLARPHPMNRFMSGMPALLAARALGLEGGAFALDAACASSLYALKLACDRLRDGEVDLMVAGAVNRSDSLFLHVGFCALSAMSRSGRSRPFHRDADGLVPAEGAGFVALKRLDDAVSAGDRILGVIRATGLSNDGRGRGLLAPSEEGQIRAMRLAYEEAGLAPADVSLVECHATGTAVGDAAELRSMSAVFARLGDVPIGSYKSNVGHLTTAAGIAGLLKVLGAIEAGELPPTLHADSPLPELSGSPFRLLHRREQWPADRPRRAAISAFGFGGNNAHLIVEAWDPDATPRSAVGPGSPVAPVEAALDDAPVEAALDDAPIAVVGLCALVGDDRATDDFTAALFAPAPTAGARAEIAVALHGLRMPPNDVAETLPQQLLVLEAARRAMAGLTLPRERTAVLIGMGCDAEAARHGARWRLPVRAEAWAASSGVEPGPGWLRAAQDAVQSALTSAGVLGRMPNVPANRINQQLDLAGPSFTLSSEELSGVDALDRAARALRAREIDAAVVGAVDFSHEVVHQTALAALGVHRLPADGAVALVLRRRADAEAADEPILAVVDAGLARERLAREAAPDAAPSTLDLGEGEADLLSPRGSAHAASGLLQIAAAILAVHHGARPGPDRTARPWTGPRAARVRARSLDGSAAAMVVREARPPAPLWLEPPLRFAIHAGGDRAELLAAVEAGRESNDGPARLVIVAATSEELDRRRAAAVRHLRGGGPAPDGVAFRERPVAGELAFVFAGAGAAYAGMGRELTLAMPGVVARVAARWTAVERATTWMYRSAPRAPHPLDQLWGASYLSQLHAELTRAVLRLEPRAAIGYSSGETNALFAFGAWRDLDAMVSETDGGALFHSELAGEFAAVRRAWRRRGCAEPGGWRAFRALAPLRDVRAALDGQDLVHLVSIETDDTCVVGGEAGACERVREGIGRDRTLPLVYELAVHCPDLVEVEAAWRELHRRPTWDVPGVRFYTSATGSWYRPTTESAAEAITRQALQTLDFRRTVEQAWSDGVRVFVEHGPRGLCSSWISQILGTREHVAVSLDREGTSSIAQVANAVAALVAAGVPVDHASLTAHWAAASASRPITAASPSVAAGASSVSGASGIGDAVLLIRAHAPVPELPPFEVQSLPPAPPLPAVAPDDADAADAAAVDPAPAAPTAVVGPIPAVHAIESPPRIPVARPRSLGPAELVQIHAGALAEQARLSAVHQAFLAQQASVAQGYLALQRTMLAGLTVSYSALSRAIAPPPRPAAPAAPTTAIAPPRPAAPAAPAIAPPPVAPSPVAVPAVAVPARMLSRAELEVHASGSISSIFGPAFAEQDRYARQVRMPEPPLLLADRVTRLDGVPGSMGKGSIWTETDVRADSWYLHEGRMPAGILIESGQADLLLISWLGVDRLNRGERVYRLLGCELTYHGELPRPGDRLVYDIHVDGHAQQGGIRLFFFHYDCRVEGELRLTVRGGQAGFFTDEELRHSAGILWDAASAEPLAGPVDPAPRATPRRSFGPADVRAFAEGRPFDCFGAGFETSQAHVRTPRIAAGRMSFLGEVTRFDPEGGPWRRGYLCAETPIAPDDWFFAGHFKGDPCMPGTLMLEGCVQAMSFYMAGLGLTLDRDGWRFEPLPGQVSRMQCRGQVTPSSRLLRYEVFVHTLSAGPMPVLVADLLCTVDGLKAFHARSFALRLVPDWPLEAWQLAPVAPAQRGLGAAVDQARLGGLAGHEETGRVAERNRFAFDYRSLLACAWGRPSSAFGPFYRAFNGTRRVARLPGPPYHFMSRILRVDGEMGAMQTGCTVEAEYDVPAEAWYFDDNGAATMPMAVLMEVALQPCGWLASFVGSALTSETDFMFRNLDGTGTLLAEVRPGARSIRTRARIVNIARSAGMIIESFAVECFAGDERLYEMQTVFGFFPPEAFENQAGLPVAADERGRVEQPEQGVVDLGARPARFFAGAPRVGAGLLSLIDRVTAHDPAGGRRGLGWIRGEKDVDPAEWFFKAHFFQDPVQPGSLGIEALCQLLQIAMIERGMGEGMAHPRFEPIAIGRPLTWKYRGQVVPANRRITLELELTETGEDDRGRFAVADAWLWVDGKRIYHARSLAMRIVAGEPPARARAADPGEELLDVAVDRWLGDHRPTWTVASLPMMSMLDRMAGAAAARAGRPVVAITDAQVHRWLAVPDGAPVRVRVDTDGDGAGDAIRAHLSGWREARTAALSRFERVASGLVHIGDYAAAPPPWPAPSGGEPVGDPYASGALFHGPAFQLLRELRFGAGWSSARLDAGAGSVPVGALGQGLLDAMTHGIPHDALCRWSPEIPADRVGYPHRVESLRFFGRLPAAGEVRVETRFAGFAGDARLPRFEVQLIAGDRVAAELRLVEVLLPKGPIGAAAPADRRAFLRDRAFVPGIALSRIDADATRTDEASVRQSDWLPGNVAHIYAVADGADLVVDVAIKDHVARAAGVHPSAIALSADRASAVARARPLRRYRVATTRDGADVCARDDGPPRLDIGPVRAYWSEQFPIGPWPVEDLYYGLIERFVGDVILADAEAWAGLGGRSALYLANHQVGIESLLFSTITSALSGCTTTTLAKAEHRTSWLGRLIEHCFAYPGVRDPGIIAFFEREDRAAFFEVARQLSAGMARGERSAMIHVEGTRSLSCRHPVTKLSSAVLDIALSVGAPIVPVRFTGALPVEELPARLEFPVGYGRQDIWIGRPIEAAELRARPLLERKQTVLDAINRLGPPCTEEVPAAPDPAFAARAAAWQAETGVSTEHAVLYVTLELLDAPASSGVRQLIEGVRKGRVEPGASAEGRWLTELARRLCGSRGPKVENP